MSNLQMTEIILSAEYATELVGKARDGAIFTEYINAYGDAFWESERKMHEDHDGYGRDPQHWIEWYRETLSSLLLCVEVIHRNKYLWSMDTPVTGSIADELDMSLKIPWMNSHYIIDKLLNDFKRGCMILGGISLLPSKWTDEHVRIALEIRMVKS